MAVRGLSFNLGYLLYKRAHDWPESSSVVEGEHEGAANPLSEEAIEAQQNGVIDRTPPWLIATAGLDTIRARALSGTGTAPTARKRQGWVSLYMQQTTGKNLEDLYLPITGRSARKAPAALCRYSGSLQQDQ